MDATTHHVIHNVITTGNRVKHPADKASFRCTLDNLETKIYGVIDGHVAGAVSGGIIFCSIL